MREILALHPSCIRGRKPLAAFRKSIRSKSTRLTKSGVIVTPHFGHTLSQRCLHFCQIEFRDRGIADPP